MSEKQARPPGPDYPISIQRNPARVVVSAGGNKSVNAVWSYEDPFPAVGQIRGHVAFYPERVDAIEVLP